MSKKTKDADNGLSQPTQNNKSSKSNGLSTSIELSLRCKNLLNMDTLIQGDKSDPYIIVYMKHNNISKWMRVGQTETVFDNLCPAFKKTFVFESDQEMDLKFEVYDQDATKSDLLGYATLSFNTLLSQLNKEACFPLKLDKIARSAGELYILAKTDADQIKKNEFRMNLLLESGFNVAKDKAAKAKASEKVKKYFEETGVALAFKAVCIEMLEKKLEIDQVYSYAAKRLREIGEEIEKYVRNNCIHNNSLYFFIMNLEKGVSLK